MHGQIHDCLRLMILHLYDKETWEKVLKKTGCQDDEHFLKLRHYDDSLTTTLVTCSSQVLGLSVDDMWLEYGRYFIQYTLDIGYAEMLLSLGSNFESFAENLDTVHTLLAVSYHNIVPPQFRCERNSDGSLVLHHYSNRPELHTLVVGLMMGAADLLHGVKLEIGVQNIDIYETDNSLQHHSALHIRVLGPGATEHIFTGVRRNNGKQGIQGGHNDQYSDKMQSSVNIEAPALTGLSDLTNLTDFNESSCLNVPTVSTSEFCTLFPYHMIFDEHLLIKQVGDMLRRFKPSVRKGRSFRDTCRIIYPRMPSTFAAIRDFHRTCFVVGVLGSEETKPMSLKGQMILIKDNHIMFMCSPVLLTLTELQQKKIFICDLPIYDTTREFVLLNQLRQAEIGISSKLEETTAALQRTSAELEMEKAKTDILLYEMLPVKVVRQLREGQRVEAEKFDTSTLLFSDIVSFTTLAAAVTPMDIVNMLNALYSLFDCLITKHGVYKVETIGDAYMVVGGVPEPVRTHAEQVALMALDMRRQAGTVTSPITGKSIQIRVGMHTGSVVAGVVGEKMPRYCLFGDTVNTASRMESHGLPGAIHVSPTTHGLLETAGFRLEKRGRIKVKGKGKMDTFFLLEAPSNAEKHNEDLEVRQGCLQKCERSEVCRIM